MLKEKEISLVHAIKNHPHSMERYIYGAGKYAHDIYRILTNAQIGVNGFIVTVREEATSQGIPVFELEEIIDRDVVIILGLNSRNAREVLTLLHDKGVDKDRIIDGGRFLDRGAERLGLDGTPVMEISTVIGCAINCKYCPQSSLIKNYYKRDKNRPSKMSLVVFEKCLEKLPTNCGIVFSAFAEPFLNSECLQMIKLACATGRKVDVSTTMAGVDYKTAEELVGLPINYFTLHVADKFNYATIKMSPEYYATVDMLINSRKANSELPFVCMCNAQADPDEKIKELCDGKVEILTTLYDRAGNLTGMNLLNKVHITGKLLCSICGSFLNRNILLPDGTVVLCCNDFSLKHPLGNLLNESYNEIMQCEALNNIRKGMGGDSAIDILCRKCSYAYRI